MVMTQHVVDGPWTVVQPDLYGPSSPQSLDPPADHGASTGQRPEQEMEVNPPALLWGPAPCRPEVLTSQVLCDATKEFSEHAVSTVLVDVVAIGQRHEQRPSTERLQPCPKLANGTDWRQLVSIPHH
jgi:hypothetical protein